MVWLLLGLFVTDEVRPRGSDMEAMANIWNIFIHCVTLN